MLAPCEGKFVNYIILAGRQLNKINNNFHVWFRHWAWCSPHVWSNAFPLSPLSDILKSLFDIFSIGNYQEKD